MAKEQQTTQKWMGDQKKTGKTCELAKYQTQQAKKPRRKSQSSPRPENNQRLAYPRLRQEAEHKSLGGSPEKTAKPGHNYTYNNPASLSKNTCEPANPRVILRRRFNPRQVSMNIFMFLRWVFFLYKLS